VRADTKFAEDFIRLLFRNPDLSDGKLIIPQVFSQILSTDATFEIATCVESKQVIISRQDDVIGHRFLVYAYDKKKDKEMKLIRDQVIKFFT
jgi:hypothetical protein